MNVKEWCPNESVVFYNYAVSKIAGVGITNVRKIMLDCNKEDPMLHTNKVKSRAKLTLFDRLTEKEKEHICFKVKKKKKKNCIS